MTDVVKPQLEEKDPIMGDVYTHPSWGIVHVSRVSGGTGVHFGSNVHHHHHIRLNIGPAKKYVDNVGEERIHGSIRGEFIEISMTEMQWATLLSSVGMGGGVPCTLTYINKERVPEALAEDVAENFHRAVKKTAVKIGEKLQTAIDDMRKRLEDPKPLGKKERGELLNGLGSVMMALTDSLPFIQKMAQEKIEQQVQEAKATIDGFLAFKAQLLGFDKFKEKVAELGSGDGGRALEAKKYDPPNCTCNYPAPCPNQDPSLGGSSDGEN